jgi:hypothetical protein
MAHELDPDEIVSVHLTNIYHKTRRPGMVLY